MQIIEQDIKSIVPYEHNNRVHSEEQIGRIARSIKEFGFNQPIVVDEDNVILVGHGRLFAALELGLKKAPVLKKVGLSEVDKRAYRILDNKLQNDSTWAFNNLELELGFLEDNEFELEPWGLDDFRFDSGEELEAHDDEFKPDLDQSCYIKTGDLIELGAHRVLCGNTTEHETVNELMNGKKAILLFTSPPYSDMRTYGENATNLAPEYIAKFISSWSEHSEYMAVNLGLKFEDGAVVPYWDYFINEAKEIGFKLLGWNIWHKDAGATVAAATNMFYLRHEFIFIFGAKRARLNRTIKNKEILSKEKLLKGKEVLIREADGKMKHTHSKLYNSHQIHSVITIRSNMTHGEHVATFPVELVAEHIKAFSKESELVSDAFLGSGTTLIAADQLNRICYGMEIEPKYCQVIIERYQKHCEATKKPFICKINGELMIPSIKTNGTKSTQTNA